MNDSTAVVLTLPGRGSRTTVDDATDLRTLIPGAETVREPIRFGNNTWDFTGYPLVNQTIYRLEFGGIPPIWRQVVKGWALLRVNPDLAANGKSGLKTDDVMMRVAAAERPLSLISLFPYVGGLALSLTILNRDYGEHLSSEDWMSFASQLAAENPNAGPASLAGYVRPLLSLWSHRGLLDAPEMFGGRPFTGRTPESVFGVPARDLNVERPAPELCGPLLGLSLWIMDNCAEDILSRLEALAATPDVTDRSREEQLEIVRQRLLDWEGTQRSLPGVLSLRRKTIAPAWATFVKLAGCSADALRNPTGEAKLVFDRLQKDLGVSLAEDGFNLPISRVPGIDGNLIPWIDSLAPTRYGLSLDHWAGSLAYCCAFVITLLTTARDRELAALPHDCLFESTYERGDVDVPVVRMRGYLVKNRKAPVAAEWIVGDDVVRAVGLIHRLKAALGLPPRSHPQTGKEVLLHPGLGRARGEQTGDTLRLASAYLNRIRTSADHLARRGVVPALPLLPDWLSHRTLRITGIEAYASQAWGDALAAAQGHWSNRKVAEGYFGHLPRSVYIADPASVEEVRQHLTGQVLLDVANDRAGDVSEVAGNGSARLEKALAATITPDLLTGPVTGRQVRQIAKRNPNVYVGELTICVFGPGGLCGSGSEADFKLCRPFVCRNSATTKAQRGRLELRRRVWLQFDGAFERARRKIEADTPGIAEEFADLDDAALRELILADLPGRYLFATDEGDDGE